MSVESPRPRVPPEPRLGARAVADVGEARRCYESVEEGLSQRFAGSLDEVSERLQVFPCTTTGGNGIDAACARSRATAFGQDAYLTVPSKAAALLHSLVRNHAQVDGNTRLGWLATVVFLDVNGHPVSAPDDDVFDLVMGVAEGSIDVGEATAVLVAWSSVAG